MHGFEAKVIEDSISEDDKRLTTLQLRYPRFIHSEFMTHRVFSRNASSSRAIPVAKMIEQVRNEPAMPVHWGKNQPGMQAREELTGRELAEAQQLWRYAAYQAAETAQKMMELGLHKQVSNRLLEPFQFISVIVTATEWFNFFELRDHADADPNIQLLAGLMKQAMEGSIPVLRLDKYEDDAYSSSATSWHLPYVTPEERERHDANPLLLAMLSAARCARVSYLTHDGEAPSMEKDLALYDRLITSKPMHASPIEHQACPDWIFDMGTDEDNRPEWLLPELHGNFVGWRQYRKMVEGGKA